MGKSSKNKKNKVPKITEAEYAAYVSALKEADGVELKKPPSTSMEMTAKTAQT